MMLFHAEASEQLDQISHNDLGHYNKERGFCGSESIHTAYDGPGDEGTQNPADGHVPGPYREQGGNRGPLGKQPENHTGEKGADLDPACRKPDAGLRVSPVFKTP